MLDCKFANLSLTDPLMLGLVPSNNSLVKWMKKTNQPYTYLNYKFDLYIRSNYGWMHLTKHLDYIHVNYIVIRNKCKGHGTKFIEMLKQCADDTGISISLVCYPLLGSEPDRLFNFYERLGFKSNGKYHVYMARNKKKNRVQQSIRDTINK